MAFPRRRWIAVASAALLVPAEQARAAPMALTGVVSCGERTELPPTAIVEVRLLDVSLADAPARTVAETSIADGRQLPIRYVLDFDSSLIEPRRSYALQARIRDGEQLLFINTMRHVVFAGGKNEGDVLVERVAGTSPPSSPRLPAGRWLAEDIRGGGVIDRLQSVLEIAEGGVVTGNAGCNRIRGTATVTAEGMAFERIISTRMACSEAVMDQERKFLAALDDCRGFRIDARQRKLILLDAAGRPVMRLAAL